MERRITGVYGRTPAGRPAVECWDGTAIPLGDGCTVPHDVALGVKVTATARPTNSYPPSVVTSLERAPGA